MLRLRAAAKRSPAADPGGVDPVGQVEMDGPVGGGACSWQVLGGGNVQVQYRAGAGTG